MKFHVIVTGARGFIGSNIAEAFPGAELFEGDITEPFEHEQGGVLIHCAAALKHKPVREQFDVNVWGTYNLYETIQPEYAVYVSTQSKPGENSYALTKWLGERIALNHGCVLRLTYPFGPGMGPHHLVSRLKKSMANPDTVIEATPVNRVVEQVKDMLCRREVGSVVELAGTRMTIRELSEWQP